MRTQCCGAEPYRDEIDGGLYCSLCDSEVDPATGRKLTEPERMTALAERTLRERGKLG